MKFISLEKALDGLYDKQLADLPPNLQARVIHEFHPLSWGNSNAAQRQQLAKQCDGKNDPGLESERKYWWDLGMRKEAIERDIEKWELIKVEGATDLAIQEKQLLDLYKARGSLSAMLSADVRVIGLEGFDVVLNTGLGSDARPDVGSAEWRSQTARNAAIARHSKPGAAHEKKAQMLAIWGTGKYSSRDACAEQECAALNISFASARKALINAPNPRNPTYPLPSKG